MRGLARCRAALFFCGDLLVVLGALAAPVAFAQERPNLSLLLFDAVPLAIEDAAATGQPDTDTDTSPANSNGDAPPYRWQEMAKLPQDNPMSIQSLISGDLLPSGTIAPDTLVSDIARYEAELKQLEQSSGDAFAQSLPENLQALAKAYERAGDYTKALPLYERAKHIVRVNTGLFSLEQTAIVEHLFSNNLARGDVVAADEQQEYLYYLRSKAFAPNGPEMIEAMQEFAHWKVQAFQHFSLAVPAISQASEDGDNTEVAVDAPRVVQEKAPVNYADEARFHHLSVAQSILRRISRLLLENFGMLDPRLPENELQLAITNYLLTTNAIAASYPIDGFQQGFEPPELSIRRYGYSEGKNALERRIEYLQLRPTHADTELAEARLDLADWMITTRTRTDIEATYEKAFEDFVNSGASAEQQAELFSPVLPVRLPAIVPLYFTRSAFGIGPEVALEYKGYIDAEFGISKIGDSKSPQILYRTPGTPDEVADILIRSLRRALFRPRLENGKLVDEDHIKIRYYYTY